MPEDTIDRGPELEIKSADALEPSVEALNTEAEENDEQDVAIAKVDAPKIESFTDFNKVRKETKAAPVDLTKPTEVKDDKIKEAAPQEVKDDDVEKKAVDESLVLNEHGKPRKARDYSGLDESEVKIFKRMGQEAFEHQKPIYLEYKQLKLDSLKPKQTGDLPDSYYSHPEAYVLSPEYKAVAQGLQEAEIIRDHWKRQEINIKKNGKFQELYRDPNTKQLQLGPVADATDDDEIKVSKYVDASRELYIKQNNKLESITEGFKVKHDKDIEFIRNTEAQFFKGYDDDKHPTAILQKKIIASMPKSLQGHPLAGLLAKTGSANAQLNEANRLLREENAKLKGVKADTEAAPPTKKVFGSGTINKAKASNGAITTFSEFNDIRKGIKT